VGAVPGHAQSFTTDWELSTANGNKPSYIGTDDDTRGIAYGVVDDGNGNMVERVFVVTGGGEDGDPYTIKVLNASDGTDTGNDLSGISSFPSPGSGRKLTDVGVTDDGIIIACNEVNNTFLASSGTENFRCWRWDSLTDSPTQIIDYTPPDKNDDDVGEWIARNFDVTGSAADNTLTLLTDASKTQWAYRFTTQDNGQSFSVTEVERKPSSDGNPPVGNLHGVGLKGTGASDFLFTGAGATTPPIAYAADGTEQARNQGSFNGANSTIKFFEVGSKEWAVAFRWDASGENQFAELVDITDSFALGTKVAETANFGRSNPQANLNGTGDVDVRINDDNTATVFVLATNNGIGSYTTDAPLPVELSSFNGTSTEGAVQLTWTTASETNNAGFRIQHETRDGWADLGFVKSAAVGGTTSEANTYRFTTEDLSAGTHRFRLKQVDLDGTTHLTDAVTVAVPMQDALQLSAPSPNPVQSAATLSFAVKEATATRVALYNALGQKVSTLYQGTPPAEQSVDVTVGTETLPSGLYFVRLRTGNQTRTQRLTIVR
jgi:hypothetical protein